MAYSTGSAPWNTGPPFLSSKGSYWGTCYRLSAAAGFAFSQTNRYKMLIKFLFSWLCWLAYVNIWPKSFWKVSYAKPSSFFELRMLELGGILTNWVVLNFNDNAWWKAWNSLYVFLDWQWTFQPWPILISITYSYQGKSKPTNNHLPKHQGISFWSLLSAPSRQTVAHESWSLQSISDRASLQMSALTGCWRHSEAVACSAWAVDPSSVSVRLLTHPQVSQMTYVVRRLYLNLNYVSFSLIFHYLAFTSQVFCY